MVRDVIFGALAATVLLGGIWFYNSDSIIPGRTRPVEDQAFIHHEEFVMQNVSVKNGEICFHPIVLGFYQNKRCATVAAKGPFYAWGHVGDTYRLRD